MILDPYEKIEEEAIQTCEQYERLRAYNEMVNNALAADFAEVVNKKIVETIAKKCPAYGIRQTH